MFRASGGRATMAFHTSFNFAGDGGSLHFDSASGSAVVADLDLSDEASDPPGASGEESPYLTEIREFVEAIQGGTTPRVTFEDGIIALALAEAANESLRTGQAVPFSASEILPTESVSP